MAPLGSFISEMRTKNMKWPLACVSHGSDVLNAAASLKQKDRQTVKGGEWCSP